MPKYVMLEWEEYKILLKNAKKKGRKHEARPDVRETTKFKSVGLRRTY